MGILIDLEDNQFSDISSGKECATEVDLTSEYLKTKNKLAEFVTKQDKKEARDNLDICSETIPYESSDYSNIENVKQALDIAIKKSFDLEYFTVSPVTYDINNYLESFTSIYTMVYKMLTTTKYKIVACHEMPFTVITNDSLTTAQQNVFRSVSSSMELMQLMIG